MSRRFVMLDRDGTINEEIGYVLRPEELRLIPGALEALGGQFANFAFRAHGVEAREGARVWRPS